MTNLKKINLYILWIMEPNCDCSIGHHKTIKMIYASWEALIDDLKDDTMKFHKWEIEPRHALIPEELIE